MKVSERKIPFITKLMVDILKVFLLQTQPLSAKDCFRELASSDVILPNIYTHLRLMTTFGFLNKVSLNVQSYTLKDNVSTKKIIELIESINNYGLFQFENTTLNRIDRFIKVCSTIENKPTRITMCEMRRQSAAIGSRNTNRCDVDYRDSYGGMVYSIKPELMSKYLVWLEICDILQTLLNTTHITMKLGINTLDECNKNFCISKVNYWIINELCKHTHGLRLMDFEHNVKNGLVTGLDPELSYSTYVNCVRRLAKGGLLCKYNDGGDIYYKVTNHTICSAIVDKIAGVDLFGTSYNEYLFMQHMEVILRLQNNVGKDVELITKLHNSRAKVRRLVGIDVKSLYGVVDCYSSNHRYLFVPKPHVAKAIEVWKEVTELVKQLKAMSS